MATFNMGRQFRDRILNISDRVAAMLAAETDAARRYEILDSEICEALTGLADSNDEGIRLSRTSETKPLGTDVAITSA